MMKKALSFIFGVLIFSGLPIIGWGVTDFAGFIQNPYRISFIVMMAILSFFVAIFVPNQGRGFGEGKKLIKRQKISLLFLQILPPLIILISPYFDHNKIAVFNESAIIRCIGIVLAFFGFILMNWSIIILGKQFSVDVTIQDNHKLVTKGPYKYVRHPRYTGIILFFGSIPFIFLAWGTILLVLALIIVLLWRIKDEEKLMHQEFNEEWEKYKKRTFSLLPFVY